MRKRILYVAAATLAALLIAFIWRLDIPHWKKLDLDRLNAQAGTTRVYDVTGNLAGTLHGAENRIWIGLDQVPEHVQNAFIAAEDLRFYQHHGVDLYRVFGALWRDITTLSYSQGASTITQQLVKLTHLSSEKRLSRKAQEIWLAIKLERALSKREILEAYLNTVYFGHGAYGIEAAASAYFGKNASALTLSEGALLAGVIKAPSAYAPHINAERSRLRRNAILATMAKHGLISSAEAERASGESVRLAESLNEDRQYAWYMDSVLTEAASILNLSTDEVLTGGYRIDTGLNPDMQLSAEKLFESEDSFPAAADDGTPVQGALIMLEPSSGEVRAVVGGRRYEVALGLNRATEIKRQPGSAFKPVSTYAAAIDAFGYVPSSTVDDTPRTFEGSYAPGNAGGASYGKVTLREALSRSLNIATVDLAEHIGVDSLRRYAQRFGLELSKSDQSLSLALGSLTDGVSPAALGAAYCALANGGTRVNAHFIRAIRDSDGKTVYEAKPTGIRAVSDATAYMLTDMLKTAASTGSAKALSQAGLPIAGKTGTVSEAGSAGTRDIWTVAYTPDAACAVWMGYDRPEQHTMAASEGGSGYPARLCAAYYSAVSGELSGARFRRPSGVKAALIDSIALDERHEALLCTPRTPERYSLAELFRADDLPRLFSDNWDAPQAASDFRLLSREGETPVLAFTAMSASAEYVLTRAVNGETREIAVLWGEPGEEIRYADTDHDLTQIADYTLTPRNALLYAAGSLLTGSPSATVRYAPGGFLNKLMGAGAAEATQTPTDIEFSDDGLPFE